MDLRLDGFSGFTVLLILGFIQGVIHGRQRRNGYLLALRHVREEAVFARFRGEEPSINVITVHLEDEARKESWW
jgi:hypothetical protein